MRIYTLAKTMIVRNFSDLEMALLDFAGQDSHTAEVMGGE
jgi:hypothetical protein